MASAQVVETSVNTNNSPSQDYTTNPDDHSNHNIKGERKKTAGFFPLVIYDWNASCAGYTRGNSLAKSMPQMDPNWKQKSRVKIRVQWLCIN